MNWMPRFKGDVDGRYVELFEYQDGGDLKVVTTQAGEEFIPGSIEPGSMLMPGVIPDGSRLEIDAPTADELVSELIASGFTEKGAKEIARHGRHPAA
jgi:hypothetical protein